MAKAISPFDLHFISIAKTEEFIKVADNIYGLLRESGVDVLYDDRKVGPGFKFKDADLLGIPIQLIFGERDYKETKTLNFVNRRSGEKIAVTELELIERFHLLKKEL